MLIDVSSVFLGNRIACLRIRAFTALLHEIEFVIFRTIFLFAIIYYYTSNTFRILDLFLIRSSILIIVSNFLFLKYSFASILIQYIYLN